MSQRWIRVGVFLLSLLPLVGLIDGIASNQLGPDPAEQLMHITGEWTLRFLGATLLVSPLRHWTGISLFLRLRRMLGLFTFFYATLHLVSFAQFYTGWSPAALWIELAERPYITAGFVAWIVMLPLALTSTRSMQRRLGRRWVVLHRGVYVCAVAACLHMVWQVRSDAGEALFYSVFFALLLAWRVWRSRGYGRGRLGS